MSSEKIRFQKSSPESHNCIFVQKYLETFLEGSQVARIFRDAYHTRSVTRNAGASVQRAVVVWQAQMGSYPRPVVRNVQAVIGT
jgi:hypothetical protein